MNDKISMQFIRRITGVFLTMCLSMLPLNSSAAGDSSPAALLAVAFNQDAIEFTVISTGCTQKEHFSLNVTSFIEKSDDENRTQQIVDITLIRHQRDFCRRMPGPKIISFELPDSVNANAQIRVNNPYTRLQKRGGR